jgi:hypothetical protein
MFACWGPHEIATIKWLPIDRDGSTIKSDGNRSREDWPGQYFLR